MSTSPEIVEPTVLARIEGAVGRLTLNRPRAINALDLPMIGLIDEALDAWEHDPAVTVVVLDGAGERGLCAGGDVRSLYDEVVAGRPGDTAAFFLAEYRLNARLAEYPKPIVTLADGITMGGGIGLASHAAIRVVTERSKLAMPETRIGFTPDVGGTWLLGRAPGHLGEYLGVTGTTMDAADAVYAGFADHLVPSDRLDELRAALAGGGDASAIVAELAIAPGVSRLEAARAWVDETFSADTLGEVAERLRARAEPAASTALDLMGELAPTGMAVTFEAVRRARDLRDLRADLAQEYGLVMWFAHTQPDLVEGIRAQLVDKTRDPHWNPAALADVDRATIEAAFASVPALPLWE
ncbi:enoyl-CoA hydratase/isomerase family protein [Microbacterium horticulturae]|uniref:3-hydroxyisobutyryl-CoA hydrolase n=1 Tax=Microbacterium horticulturae TaxID=3028316 RepID=A0ABY8C0Z3_9MICO|nr:enoyl-CoA hydratase/isomerase family protein [Microbacterium sp. KACC 23027]WEG08328.1 enoyl-CoA hydratase/isomerase family protein [Microbacterium sp. KACC 23027]